LETGTYYLPPMIKSEKFEFIFGIRDPLACWSGEENAKLINHKSGSDFLHILSWDNEG